MSTVKKKTAKKKEVATKNESTGVQDLGFKIAVSDGTGLEGADADSFAIPFIKTIQALSPQMDRTDAQFIKGAKQGDLFNTVSGELFPADEENEESGIFVVPCALLRRYIEWKPRSEGGGFIAEYLPNDPIVKTAVYGEMDGGKSGFILPNGNELKDTRNHYCLLLREGALPSTVIISFSSIFIKTSKNWATVMKEKTISQGGKFIPLPSFAQHYQMLTNPDSNEKGNWAAPKLIYKGTVDQATYDFGKEFKDLVNSGEVQAAYDSMAASGEESKSENESGDYASAEEQM